MKVVVKLPAAGVGSMERLLTNGPTRMYRNSVRFPKKFVSVGLKPYRFSALGTVEGLLSIELACMVSPPLLPPFYRPARLSAAEHQKEEK